MNDFKNHQKVFLFFVSLFLISLILRGWKITAIPPGMHGDEAEWALIEKELITGQRKEIIGIGRKGIYFDFPTLGFWAQGIFLKIFGVNIFGARISSVLIGSLTVVLFFIFLKIFFSLKIAFLASLLLSFSHYHIAYSRMALSNIWTPFWEVLTFLLLFQGLKKNSWAYLSATGASLGLGLYFHHTTRVLPLIIGGFAILRIFSSKDNERKKYLKQICIISVLGLLVFLPQLIYFAKNPQDICARCGEISIFSHLNEYYSKYQTRSLGIIIIRQFFKNIQLFFVGGDIGYYFYGFPGPMLSPIAILLTFVGSFSLLKNINREINQFIAIWILLIIILGGVLTIDAPSSQRLVGIIPAIFFLIALGIKTIYLQIKKLKTFSFFKSTKITVSTLIISLFVVADFTYNGNVYFIHYIHTQEGWAQREPATAIAKLLTTLPYNSYVYMLRENSWLYFRHGTIRFLTPQVKGEDVIRSDKVIPSQCDKYDYLFYIMPPNSPSAPKLKHHYPHGVEQKFFNPRGNTPWFWTFKVNCKLL